MLKFGHGQLSISHAVIPVFHLTLCNIIGSCSV